MQMHRYSRNMAMNLEQTKQRENSRAQEGGGRRNHLLFIDTVRDHAECQEILIGEQMHAAFNVSLLKGASV